MTYKSVRIDVVPSCSHNAIGHRCEAAVGSETLRGSLHEVKEQIDAALRKMQRLAILNSVEQWR